MNWRKWVRPGLVVTVIAAPIAVFFQKGSVETDLAARVSNALAANGQNWATVSVAGRDVVVSGIAPASEAEDSAIRTAGGIVGVRGVADATTLLPAAVPYVWSARRAGRQVTITGSVPSDGVRAAILATARRAVPQAEIVDRMSLARGAPASFALATAFALGRLPALSEGLVTLTDATFSVSGTATDSAAYGAFRTSLAKDVPPSIEIGPVDVLAARASRFVWSVNVDRGTVTVAGNVPNEVVRETLAGAIKAILPGLTLVDSVTVASGEPPGFAEAASFAVAALQRLQRGGITLDGLSIDVAGEAKSVQDYEALLTSLTSGLPEGVKVASAQVTPATVSPYVWQGDVADGKITLTGYAPSLEWRTELTAFARSSMPGLPIDDRVRVAKGEPRMDWVGAVKFATAQLGLLGRGTVAISATGYSISGEAKDPKSYLAILDQTAKTLPAGLVLKAASVQPPRVNPFRFVADRRDGKVIVSGFVGREEDRQAILAAARRVAGSGEVVDNLAFASGAPTGFVPAASAAVRSLARLAGGRADMIDQAVALSGTAYQEAAVQDVDLALRDALPAGFTLTTTNLVAAEPGQPLPAGACREQLQIVLKAGRIEFDANNPVVTTDSLGILDRAAGTILRCPEAEIEVGVHSDNDGSGTTALRDRTQSRAEAIVDYLVGAGIQRERLTATGYGATKPIGDNTTAAGRAANRRVEFSVAVPAGG
jgi:OOP family OmpA-OmpF porin